MWEQLGWKSLVTPSVAARCWSMPWWEPFRRFRHVSCFPALHPSKSTGLSYFSHVFRINLKMAICEYPHIFRQSPDENDDTMIEQIISEAWQLQIHQHMTGDGPKLRIVATRNVRNGEALSSLRYCGTGQLGWRMLAAKSRCFVFFGWWRWRTRNVCVFLGSHFFLTFLTRHFWWNPIFRFHHNLSDVSWEILRILEKFSRLPVLGSKPFLSSSARWIWIPAFRCSNPKVLSFLALNPSTQRQKSRVKVLNNVNPGSLTLGIPWLTKWWLTLIKWRNLRGTIQVWSLLHPKVVLDALGKLRCGGDMSFHFSGNNIFTCV